MANLLKVALFVAFLIGFSGNCVKQNAPEVQIAGGTLRGTILKSGKGRDVYAFMGVRYAKPPTGDLRFKAPVAAVPWTGVFDASRPHNICPQYNILDKQPTTKGVEDCLFLNVYSPQLQDETKPLLPVIFFIHGGGYEFGTASSYALEPAFIMDKNVVFVMPNYRLGPLGFLSTGDEVVPGNNGLKDQAMALKWTKDNIKRFGGDPERIIVSGQSAGGASAHLHMLSPLTKDLIKGVMAISGVSLLPWSLSVNNGTVSHSIRLAELFDCPTSSSTKMVECLRTIDATEMISKKPHFFEWGFAPIVSFKPVIEPNNEGAFITKHPIDIIRNGEAADVPFLTGITAQDGALRTAGYFRYPNLIEQFSDEFDYIAPIVLEYVNNDRDVSKQVRDFYFGNRRINPISKKDFTEINTDTLLFLGAHEAVDLHRKYSKQPVYYYLFGYHGSTTHGTYFAHSTSHDYGVCHSDDLLYIFNVGLFPNRKLTKDDEDMVEVITTIWENFAATGNPTPENRSHSLSKWKPVKNDEKPDFDYYFIKNSKKLEMRRGLRTKNAHFWKNLGVFSKVDKHVNVHSEL